MKLSRTPFVSTLLADPITKVVCYFRQDCVGSIRAFQFGVLRHSEWIFLVFVVVVVVVFVCFLFNNYSLVIVCIFSFKSGTSRINHHTASLRLLGTLKFHVMRTQSLQVLPLKPAVGQYICFLANFYPSGPFTCIFPKPFPSFSCASCG